MEANALPTDAFRRLLPALIKVVTTAQENEGPLTPQAKQALLQATNEFKDYVAFAKRLASDLPGGDLTLGEQDQVIDMLERLRDKKKWVVNFPRLRMS
ncbi:hypothetical protein SISSUDRAFT_989780 [Sistotremastrum suecicum HHB10207 ss-3]|uniref:Mediator complex subunit 9 n=1 Tax=Sistotremastrum suecicum HHB10207 ss-3 TaxID=1314776 RepID=A0A166B5M0_9AGAM|nr:hypothetical protein SISSUDRAFT_989780 [Sistotremastrum suecicum HHB10207 ss-3]